jgi:hypothetical protein
MKSTSEINELLIRLNGVTLWFFQEERLRRLQCRAAVVFDGTRSDHQACESATLFCPSSLPVIVKGQ